MGARSGAARRARAARARPCLVREGFIRVGHFDEHLLGELVALVFVRMVLRSAANARDKRDSSEDPREPGGGAGRAEPGAP